MRTLLPLVLGVLIACGVDPPEDLLVPDGSAPDSGVHADTGVGPEDGGVAAGDAGVAFDAEPLDTSPARSGLDLNDVSFLIPIADPSALWRVDEVVDGKRLVEPQWAAQIFPPFEDERTNVPPREERLSHFFVVGVRVDPCFPSSAEPNSACRRQIRLIAQPVWLFAGSAFAADATVHLLYDFDQAEFDQIAREIEGLARLAGDRTTGPLGVHPVLVAEGLNGSYGRALKSLVRTHARSERLTHIAVMDGNGAVWTFAAADIVGGNLAPREVARVSSFVQRVTQPPIGEALEGFELDPEAPAGDPLTFFHDSDEFLTAPEATFLERYQAAEELLHPTATSPQTHDCVSCHIANYVLDQAQRARPTPFVGRGPAYSPGGFDLRRLDQALAIPTSFRAFGWFDDLPAIAQRTINESAAIAIAMSPSDGRR